MTRLKRVFIWTLLGAALLAIAGIAWNLMRATDPHRGLGEWENVHDWRKRGECIECHSARTALPLAAGNPQGRVIPPAEYHTDEFRRYTHGRHEKHQPQRCAACHERSACIACHARLPESHSEGFTRPQGDTPGAQRHVLLGRVRPSSCLACHGGFMHGCIDCHGPAQMLETQARAYKMLGCWAGALEITAP